ncbi:MAG TPA: hypothetical protein VF221_09885 [Chloroflexota bacterium]
MLRSCSLLLVSLLALGAAFHVRSGVALGSAAARPADRVWRLGPAYYPTGTRVLTASAVSNADIQDFFGSMHASSYASLRRVNNHGWLQIGTFLKSTGRPAVRHILTWSYVVSYYPASAAALHAVTDIRGRMHPLAGVGPYGRIARFVDAAGDRETFSTLGRGTTVVEMFCKLQRRDERQFGQLLGEYCTEQRHALARMVMSAPTPPTATPRPTMRPPTATPQPIAPSPTPTALPAALSSPQISFYTQGSHDTCTLSGQTITIPNTTPEMYVKVLFPVWRGYHQIVYEWYSPDGSLFFNTSYSGTDLGTSVLCAWMSIAGTDAADLPGAWTLRLRIDGQEGAAAPFTITEARTPTTTAG